MTTWIGLTAYWQKTVGAPWPAGASVELLVEPVREAAQVNPGPEPATIWLLLTAGLAALVARGTLRGRRGKQ